MTKYVFLIAALVALGGWSAPHHYFPWTAFYNEAPFFVSLLLLAVAACRRPPEHQPVATAPLLVLLPALLACVPIAQWLVGKIFFASDAWLPAFYLAATALAVAVGARLDRLYGSAFVEGLAALVLVGAALATILAAHQWLRLDSFGLWLENIALGGRPYANLSQPNNLATFLCCGLVAALYLHARGRVGGVILGLLALLLLTGVAMTRSRTSFVIMAVLVAWVFWGRARGGLRASGIQFLAGFVVFAALWTLWPAVSDALLLHAEPTSSRLGAEALRGDLRLVIWRQLIEALWQQPFSGWGWNQVAIAQVAVAADSPSSVFVEHSHNIVLDLLIWNGVPIGALVLFALAAWLWSRARRVDSPEGWFGFAFMLVVGAHGMLELPLEYAYFLLPLALCAGIVESRCAGATWIGSSRWPIGAVAGIGAALFVYTTAEYLQLEADNRLMRFQTSGFATKADPQIAGTSRLLDGPREYIRFARTQARESMSAEELDWMGMIAQRYPYLPVLYRHALALGLNHRYAEAGLEWVRLHKLHSARDFDEALESWLRLAERHPQLTRVVIDDVARPAQ